MSIDIDSPTGPVAPVVPAIDAACDRIAPTWPLDQFIAVNPYWGWRASPVAEAAARLAVLAGTRLTMPRAWFRDEWRAGRLLESELDGIALELDDAALAVEARAALRDESVEAPLTRLGLVSDRRTDEPVPGTSWNQALVHQIGQHCAAFADEWQSTWQPHHDTSLYTTWLDDPSVTHAMPWSGGSRWARRQLSALPTEPVAAIDRMLDDLRIADDAREAYLTAALCSVNGWAAWCAYVRWQARLSGGDDDTIVELLAVRVACDWLLDLDDRTTDADTRIQWAHAWSAGADMSERIARSQRVDWALQEALERTLQRSVASGLPAATPTVGTPPVQAVFCIDVRSEVFRRALETAAPAVHTRGFAGFFGLPIAYAPAGSALVRPQLPGLIAPAITVTDHSDADGADAAIAGRAGALDRKDRWGAFKREPTSMFSFVESLGLTYAVKLVKDSLGHHQEPWEQTGLGAQAAAMRPTLPIDDAAAAAALGHRVLTTMGLVDDFAPLVLLCGHGSTTVNNPHAAGLDCGACGGQAGDVNARVLASLLNDPRVRDGLAVLGIEIPDDTWFVAGLHDTTTDRVELFDTVLVPSSHHKALGELGEWLRQAGNGARAERADSLGLGHLADDAPALEKAIIGRALDWAQLRPEWGLAGNAAFVVAPRWRTRHLDLDGRSFLHDYDWRLDPDGAVLTTIMTAPMVVTNWINMQYLASTVDNRRYGSGNKVLHNVVGGRVGVFEGNGGDLRIGLAEQSLHDGETLRHPPLRLSVFIEAPAAAIDRVIAEHAVVSDLVHGGWLHLLRIDTTSGSVERRLTTGWTPL